MCLYPRLIKNPKYKPNKKNGGKPPFPIDPRVLYVPIGCNDCIECFKQKARSWQTRLLEDIRTNPKGSFITLTFSNESIEALRSREELSYLSGYALDNAIATKAVRLWLERWRKKYKRSVRHFLITELGHQGTENIHLHGIVWCEGRVESVRETWQYGFIWPRPEEEKHNYVSERTVNYITKYITKRDEKHKLYRPKILTSKGIGNGYTKSLNATRNFYNGLDTLQYYRTRSGHKIALPIYWRNKIYSENERELLWLQRLDENTRFVCGEKIKADDTKGYFSLLEWHRERNAKLGFGDGKRDEEWWKRKEYEEAQRKIMMQRRLGK